MDAGFSLPGDLLDEVAERLGVARPTTLEEMAAWYRRWVSRVPFDPVAKMAAVRAGGVPPGGDPVEVARRWLDTGLGSTCWGHCAVLCAVFADAGAETSVGLDRMLDVDLVDFHSFAVVWTADGPVTFDPIHPSATPLPPTPGARGDHPGYHVMFTEEDGRLIHGFDHELNRRGPGRYHCLSLRLGLADVDAFCRVSADHSGVTAGRYFRRLLPADGIALLRPTDDGATLTDIRWAEGHLLETTADPADALDLAGLAPAAGPMLRAAGLGSHPHPWIVGAHPGEGPR